MHDTTSHNGQRLRQVPPPPPAVPATIPQRTDKQRLLAVVENNGQLQHVLTKVSTPAGKILKMLGKAIGPAEAEIEFVERITYRESKT